MIKKFKLSNSSLTLDLKHGGKVHSLHLSSPEHPGGREVIQNLSENFFLSGSYFLFPWVNRIKTSKFTHQGKLYDYQGKHFDGNGFPIHGMVYDSERKIWDEKKDKDSYEIVLSPALQTNHYPSFLERYLLRRDSLSIHVSFQNTSNDVQFFSFGYHPYFNLGIRIDCLQLSTNFMDLIPLSENYIPKEYILPDHRKFLFKNGEKIGNKVLDHCITGTPDFENPQLTISRSDTRESLSLVTDTSPGKIPLNFFQLYTPPDRNSIAIEPMSSSGNVFQSTVSLPSVLFPGETKEAGFTIYYKFL